MVRLNGLVIGGGLGLVLVVSGCHGPQSEVPIGRSISKEAASATPPVQFSTDPAGQLPGAYGQGAPSPTAPPAVTAPGAQALPGNTSAGSFGLMGSSATAVEAAAQPHATVPARPSFGPPSAGAGGADSLPDMRGAGNPN